MDAQTFFCRSCKATIAEGVKFCPACGAEVADGNTIREQMERKRETETRQRQVWWFRLTAFVCPLVGVGIGGLCLHRGGNEDRMESLGLFLASFVGVLVWWMLIRIQVLEWAWFVPPFGGMR